MNRDGKPTFADYAAMIVLAMGFLFIVGSLIYFAFWVTPLFLGLFVPLGFVGAFCWAISRDWDA